MKKSLLALVLALIMCLSIFCTGCGSSKDEENPDVMKTDSETKAITLTLYAPTKSTTTEKEIAVVEEAFNTITQAKFNTNVVLKLIPEDEYDATIAATVKNANISTEPENKEDKDGKYPAVKKDQLDIFLVKSFETYYELAKNGDLAPLDEEIAEPSKLLNSYVYPYLLRAAKVDGSTYGVFNNTIFGDYEYLLLNKELVDKYNYPPEKLNDISIMSMFLQEVKNNEAGVIPFLGELEAPVVYWNDTESLIGAYLGSAMSSSGAIDATSYRPEALYPGNLFNSTDYMQWMKEYNELYQANCLVAETEENKNSKFAATVIEGDVTLSPTYADVYGNYKTDDKGFKYITDAETGVDYYVSVYKRPLADNNNVFNAGFVVSASTEDIGRCMEIITCLNTDAQISNIFTYGVQDVHYTIDEKTGLVHKTTDDYAMDIENIGNIYLLKPSDDMNDFWKFMSANEWQNAKNANRESIMSPFLGYYYNPEKPAEEDLTEDQVMVDKTFEEVYAEVVKLSANYFQSAKTYTSANGEDFSTFFTKTKVTINEDPMVQALADYQKGIYYMAAPYNEWYQKHYAVSLTPAE